MHLNVNAIPDWIYFGKTEGNIMHLERMEKYNSELHSDICSLIF